MFRGCRLNVLPELPVLNKNLSTHIQIVMHLPPVNFPQIISKHPFTVPMNAGGDKHTINWISDQCFWVDCSREERTGGKVSLG